MSSAYTDNLGFRKPTNRDTETYNAWDVVINENMDTVDEVFGNRNYTEQNFIANSDNHTLSIDKLDMSLKAISNLTPSQDQMSALAGEGTPSASNKYVTKSYVTFARKEVLFPEFVSATFSAPTNHSGVLSASAETSGDYTYNSYSWESAVATLQSYNILVQWRVPETFVDWDTTRALTVDIATELTDVTKNKVVVSLSKDGSATAPVVSADSTSVVAATWSSDRVGSQGITFGNAVLVPLSLSAGSTLNIKITMSSKDNNYVKIGAITILYTA